MPNGLATTVPWPKPFSARWTVESLAGTVPVTVARPGMTKSAPRPSERAASVRADEGRSAASFANVVLQERAKAVISGTRPRSNLPSLGTTRFSMVVVPGQSTWLSACTSSVDNAAAAVTILNVEPGGYRPLSAIEPSFPSSTPSYSRCARAMVRLAV